MRSKLTIMTIVVVLVLAALSVLSGFVRWLGVGPGLLLGFGLAAAALTIYRFVIQPWQHRWGATDDEVVRAMPGDEIIPDAASTTRAITIRADPERIWPCWCRSGSAGPVGTATTGSTTTATPAPT